MLLLQILVQVMTDNTNKPGDQRSDGPHRQRDKASETLSKDTPEVDADNLRAAHKANPNRTDTLSPDGKSRFSLTDDKKAAGKQARSLQEKAYRDAGLGDPHEPIGKPSESGIDSLNISERAAKALNQIIDSGKSAVREGAKLWQGAHNGMHELVDDTVQSVSVANEYYGNSLAGKVNLGADAREFARAISNGLSQRLGTAGDYYFRQVPNGEANLGKDIGIASKVASDHWNSMNSEQKGHFIGKEVVPLLVPGAVGVVAKEIQGANLIANAGEAITAISSSEKFAEIEQKMAQLQGHIHKMTELAKPLEPAYAAASGGPEGPGRRPSLPESPKKGDNYLVMSTSDEGESLPRQEGKGREREPITEKIPPSEAFKIELNQAIEGLSKQERDFLREHKIEVKPVRRITDVPDADPNLGGCYKSKENVIYVPEQLFQRGQWTENNDLAFILRHEFGHAFNENRGQFGNWLSNDKRFAKVFSEDFNKVPANVQDLLLLSEKYKPLERAREEVFSDMYAHATGLQSNNRYSQLMKQYFPSCFKYLEDMPKW